MAWHVINFALIGHVGEQLKLPPIPLSFAERNKTRLVIIKFIGALKRALKGISKLPPISFICSLVSSDHVAPFTFCISL